MTGTCLKKKSDDIIISGGEGGAALLFHGFSDTPATLADLGGQISRGLRCDVHIPLLPGHGGTLEELGRSRHTDWIEFAEGYARKLSAEYSRVDIIGFSMGTLLAHLASFQAPKGRTLFIAPPWQFRGRRRRLLFFAPFISLFKKYKYKRLDEEGGNLNIRDKDARALHKPFFEKEPLSAIIQYEKLRKAALSKSGMYNRDVMAAFGAYDRVAPFYNAGVVRSVVGDNLKQIVLYKNSGHMLPVDGDRARLGSDTVLFLRGGADE